MREIPKMKNTVFISSTVSTTKSVEESFRFIIEELPKYYKELEDILFLVEN